MKHPSIENLALYAGGELPWWTRWTVRRHVNACTQCQAEIALFQEAAGAVCVETGEMPAGVQWERLAAEMRANVRLGLEASEAISAYGTAINAGPAQGMSWRMAALTTGFVLLLSIGYWLNAAKKSEQIATLRGPAPIVVEASERGVGMSDGSKGMELQGPKANHRAAIVTVSTMGSAGAQYVDEETGQVTVNHVYVE
ncbi:MAG: hypothetical protein ACKV2U_20675 [Bryobacteraceae bacterium]